VTVERERLFSWAPPCDTMTEMPATPLRSDGTTYHEILPNRTTDSLLASQPHGRRDEPLPTPTQFKPLRASARKGREAHTLSRRQVRELRGRTPKVRAGSQYRIGRALRAET
jgi:hypothetical protein